MTKIGVVGQGVIGCSTALALLERFPKLNVSFLGSKIKYFMF
jgi:glycine/D-amino acid oxidase-like deaminating enzyme